MTVLHAEFSLKSDQTYPNQSDAFKESALVTIQLLPSQPSYFDRSGSSSCLGSCSGSSFFQCTSPTFSCLTASDRNITRNVEMYANSSLRGDEGAAIFKKRTHSEAEMLTCPNHAVN
ncbi:unnamed protein product [Acanthoscelides obtectus]|uniref:Uncharacterized protein n=1 Tax=Acanthoscelides obtectus TaxID=200917 RepID=A0A9P0LE19_ACAOB|nr:unnamed protein product [Acanthoscelides obtectus]CAK1670638.1 hypothetical protein AOBTE_LOCUS27727 [Acanthoscelides obtectus]